MMTAMAVASPGGGGYDAVAVSDTAALYMGGGVLGIGLYLLILLSYCAVPNVKSQHPAAELVLWQVVTGLATAMGFVLAFASSDDATCPLLGVYLQFWALASCLWYLMLSLDLLVALVNPWMGYACKAWAYHTMVWGASAAAALVMYQQRLGGRSALNLCWVHRTAAPKAINRPQWALLFAPIVLTIVVSLAVLLFASFRFARRQLDVTYRSKRRLLMQYYRYLVVFGGYWGGCGVLYYAAYDQGFHGAMAGQVQLVLGVVYSSYPLLLLVVWVVNTEVYQHWSGENALTSAERGAENKVCTEHFSAVLRRELMRYTTAGIRCSITDATLQSPLLHRPRVNSVDSGVEGDVEGDTTRLYREKKRLATTIYNGEYRYYEKLGFTDYAPKIFQNIRVACGIRNAEYEKSFVSTLLERASEGKSGMLFYFTSDRKYLVKTMTKREHAFLLRILPLYHQYVLRERNTLLCRFLGCHSMQLPVGWNKMFFIVMENVFADGPVDERYDLKGIFRTASEVGAGPRAARFYHEPYHGKDVAAHDSQDLDDEDEVEDDEADHVEFAHPSPTSFVPSESQPLLRRGSSRSSLRHDNDFVCRRASMQVNATTRANLLAQITNDCGFLQQVGIMDYSFLLGIQTHPSRMDAAQLKNLAHNAVASEDLTKTYYLGFVDILQHYNWAWKAQHVILSTLMDKRTITAVPPAEYALRFLGFIHTYLLCDPTGVNIRSYGSVDAALFPLTNQQAVWNTTVPCRAMQDDLRRAIQELTRELFATRSHVEALPILQALSRLVAGFPCVKQWLGQMLCEKESTTHYCGWTELARRFLYNNTTCLATLELLAILISNARVNQRRLVRYVKGLRVRLHSNRRSNLSTTLRGDLLILTLPTQVRAALREHEARYNSLAQRRLPTGQPPKETGCPAPCYCDECNGKPQFLSTWTRHFEDLSKWTRLTSATDQLKPRICRLSLMEALLSQDYELQCIPVQCGPATSDLNPGDGSDVYLHVFVPKNETNLRGVDPQTDVCAVEVDHVDIGEHCRRLHGDPKSMFVALGREPIVLLEAHMEFAFCHHASTQHSDDHIQDSSVPAGISITGPSTMSSELQAWNQVAAYLTDSERMALRQARDMGSASSFTCTTQIQQSETALCEVRIQLDPGTALLEVSCFTSAGEVFVGRMDNAQLEAHFPGAHVISSVLGMDDHSLFNLLFHCRLCRSHCSNGRDRMVLSCKEPELSSDVPVEPKPNKSDASVARTTRNTTSTKISGLSREAASQLERLAAALMREPYHDPSDILARLLSVVHDCDDRMMHLACQYNALDANRRAARERCRKCRNKLIEECKLLKLDSADGHGSEASRRIRKAIAHVLQQSVAYDSWETEDPRVEQLHLNKHVWASGTPDAQFYLESSSSAKVNRQRQQLLTRRLMEMAKAHRVSNAH